jgi:long-chain fatty acid transport protein
MKIRLTTKQLVAMGLLATVGFSSVAVASGFQLWEESAAGTGDYHAGGAAEANDASTEFYNPAGMIRLKKPQVSVGAVLIPLNVKWNGSDTVSGTPFSYKTNGWLSGDTVNLVPNMHLVYPINKRMAFGFGVTVPFGLSTNYAYTLPDATIRSTVTKIMAFNFNPSIAYALTSKWSVGLGVDVVYGTATYNTQFGTSQLTNDLHDTSLGWNGGILYQLSPRTRFGFSYRSRVVLHAKGVSKAISPTVTTENNNLNAKLTLPPTWTVSVFQKLTPKWDLLASAYYTQWNVFSSLVLKNTTLGNISVHENYHNTWNFALGTQYHYSPKLMFKFGVGYDMTPSVNGYRDTRLPDNNRVAVAAGVHAVLSKTLALDFGWTHLFVKNVAIDNQQSGLAFYALGTSKMSADVIGMQLSWSFDKI